MVSGALPGRPAGLRRRSPTLPGGARPQRPDAQSGVCRALGDRASGRGPLPTAAGKSPAGGPALRSLFEFLGESIPHPRTGVRGKTRTGQFNIAGFLARQGEYMIQLWEILGRISVQDDYVNQLLDQPDLPIMSKRKQ